MHLKKLVASAIAVAVVLASNLMTVSAQQRERGRPEGGRPEGGRPDAGRFGGGAPGGGAMFGRGAGGGDQVLIGLLRVEAVRQELAMDEVQLAGLRKMNEQAPPVRPDFDWRNATPEQQSAFTEKMRTQANERAAEAKADLEQLLLPNQFERLEQIALQVQGARALVNPEVAEKLGLSGDVTAKMSKEIETSTEKSREMVRAAMQDRNFDGIREKTQAAQKELDEKLVSHLSSDQKAKYEEMKGPAFEMPEMAGAFGRGGPGGPGGVGGDRRGPGAAGGFGGRRGGDAPGAGRGGDRGEGERRPND